MLFKCWLLATCCISVSCKCRDSYMTLCDTFEDFKQITDSRQKAHLKAVMIGSEHGEFQPRPVDVLWDIKYDEYHRLTMLMFIKAISELEVSDYRIRCSYDKLPLKHVIYYGNTIKSISDNQLPRIPLKILSLVNNKIESIKPWSLIDHRVEEIDLSDNLLEVIESNSLPKTENVTKVVTIRNNKLTHIDPESFPESLEHLVLDGNKLRFIQSEVLETLPNLKELSLSRNNFNTIPRISELKKLVVFDISHNSIKAIRSRFFQNLNNLKLLDLSQNHIENRDALQWLSVPKKQPTVTISLAGNRLQGLDFDNVTFNSHTKVVLYGNPWDCAKWTNLTQQWKKFVSPCDLEFEENRDVPFCVDYSLQVNIFDNTWSSDQQRFREKGKDKGKKDYRCYVESGHTWMKPTSGGCVA